MILAITDGVGLTNKLSLDPANAKKHFSTFFRAQIKAFEEFACGTSDDPHWRIVKTTGDGLIFATVDDDRCAKNCGEPACHRFLAAIHAAATCKDLVDEGIKLRSVIHYCPKVIHGTDLVLQDIKSKMIDDNARAALTSDIFGLEVIRLARVAALAKGPFHLLTRDFVWELVKEHRRTGQRKTTDVIGAALSEWGKAYKGPVELDSTPTPVPFLKGFEQEDMEDAITLENPYMVWEFTMKEIEEAARPQ